MMTNTKKLALAATATLLLAACSETTRSTDWYIQNTADQANKLTECQQNPEISKTPNCVTAAEAELIIQKGNDAIKEHLDGLAK